MAKSISELEDKTMPSENNKETAFLVKIKEKGDLILKPCDERSENLQCFTKLAFSET